MSKMKKFATVVLVLAFMATTSPVTMGATVDELQAQITALMAQITALQAQIQATTGGTTTSTSCFTMTLREGMRNDEITMLQQKLAMDSTIYPEGLVTGYFGPLTRGAVEKFQAGNGIVAEGTPETTGYGLVGPKTRAKLNELYCVVVPTTTPDGTTTPPIPPTGTGLSVSLASDTPASATIVADSVNGGQILVPFVAYNFTAGTDGDVKITEIKAIRKGVSANANFLDGKVFVDGVKKADMKSISSDNVITFQKSAGMFTVPAGTTVSVVIKGDIAKAMSAGATMALGINSASDITTDGATVSGVFPADGNFMTSANVTDLGRITITHSSNPTALDPMKTPQELWRTSIVGQNQKIEIRELNFTFIGTIDANDIQKITLTIGNKSYGPLEMTADKTVMFDMSADPYILDSGQTKVATLKGEVIGGASRNFYAALQNAGDVVAYDKNYNVFIPHFTSGGDPDTFTVVKASTATTINSGSLTITRSTDSPSGNAALSATNVKLVKYEFAATGESIKVLNLTGYLTCSSNTTATISNGKLYVDGSQVGVTDSSVTCSGSNAIAWGNFGNSFIVEEGTTAIVEIASDLTTTGGNPEALETITASLSSGTNNYQRMTSGGYGSTSAVSGNALTLRTGTLTVRKNFSVINGSASDPTAVTGEQMAMIGSFSVEPGLAEAADITQVVLKDTAGTFPTAYTNLMVKTSGGDQIGTTYGNLTTTANTTYSFVPSAQLRVQAGQQMVFYIYANVKTGLSAGAQATTTVDAVYATGVDTSATADDLNDVELQTVYVAAKGSLVVAADPDTPVAQNITSGKMYEFLRLKATAGPSENVKMTELVVSDVAGAAGDVVDFTSFKLYDITGGSKTLVAGPVSSVVTSNASPTTSGYVTFTGLEEIINKNSNKVYSIEATAINWYNGQSGNLHTYKLVADYLTSTGTTSPVTAYGVKSDASLTQNSGLTIDGPGSGNTDVTGEQMTLYRTNLSVAGSGFTPANGANSEHRVAEFVISNESNAGSYSATVSNMKATLNASNMSEGGTHATVTRTFTLYKNGTISTSNKIAELVLQCDANTNCVYGGELDFSTTSSNAIASGFTSYTVSSGTVFTSAGVEISAGSSNNIVFVADTRCPEITAADDSFLNTGLSATGVTWGDGSATSVTDLNDLPKLNMYSFTR